MNGRRSSRRTALAATQQLTWDDERGVAHSLALDGRSRVTIGRGSRSDVRLRDHRVSRHHASIELVQGQHLLRDAGSANGTFLNGLRLTLANAFALRDGDAVEIGATRIRYAGPSGAGALASTGEGACHALEDLLADGEKDFGQDERALIERTARAALSEGPLESALAGALGIVVDRIVVSTVAVYLVGGDGVPKARAARPSVAAATSLEAFAEDCLECHEGRLLWGRACVDLTGSTEETADDSDSSSAAVPFSAGPCEGVLVIQRSFGDRLDVRALALLAVMGRAIGEAVAPTLTA